MVTKMAPLCKLFFCGASFRSSTLSGNHPYESFNLPILSTFSSRGHPRLSGAAWVRKLKNMTTKDDILKAHTVISGQLRNTPAQRSVHLEQLSGSEVFLKLENYQVTGSFKVRGGLNKLSCLSPGERERGIIAASSGNHGAACAFGASHAGCPVTVCVPTYASASKVELMKSYGAEVKHHGEDCLETEVYARSLAQENGLAYVSPYNDPHIISGQGTVAVELLEQATALDAVFISVGGGGLIAGMGTYLKAVSPGTEIIACSPAASPAMHACIEAGEVIEVPCSETLSDATAGGVEPGSITFDICRKVIDRSILVSEDEISSAMRDFISNHRMLIEGSAGVALAAFLKTREDYSGKRIGIVICGANISIEKLREILD